MTGIIPLGMGRVQGMGIIQGDHEGSGKCLESLFWIGDNSGQGVCEKGTPGTSWGLTTYLLMVGKDGKTGDVSPGKEKAFKGCMTRQKVVKTGG